MPTKFGFKWTFRVGDKVMQAVNDYEKDVFIGDFGHITSLDAGAFPQGSPQGCPP
jgi:ATP-dependent exoDNAse (exonuclease V) alpha subunit